MQNLFQAHLPRAVFLLALFISGCDQKASQGNMQPPPPSVTTIVLQAEDVAFEQQLPGRLEASRTAEVRARVTGVVEKRLFVEGANVKAGQSLFKIDAAPYQARYESAKADLAKAEADFEAASYQAKRYEDLQKTQAVSEYDAILASSQAKQSAAAVLAAKSALNVAKIDLDYSQVFAPISGKIGRAFVTEGALVSATQATALALVQQIDPMIVSFNQSSNELLAMRRKQNQGSLQQYSGEEPIVVSINLPDGSEYKHKGYLLFSDISVDQSTAQIELRAEIPNPEHILLPGMFIQAKLTQATYPNAFLIPQKALTRNEKGDNVFIVGEDNILTVRPVTVAGSMHNQWLITEGLKDGERLMIEGFQKVRPGSPVTPIELANKLSSASKSKVQ
jgi:membrane fusion protein (multidrug efflux system)